MNTNKGNICTAIWEELLDTKDYLTKAEVAMVVDKFLDKIETAMLNGGKVTLSGLCSFYLKEYKARNYRNPNTGEPVEVPTRVLPKTRFSRRFIDATIEANPVSE